MNTSSRLLATASLVLSTATASAAFLPPNCYSSSGAIRPYYAAHAIDAEERAKKICEHLHFNLPAPSGVDSQDYASLRDAINGDGLNGILFRIFGNYIWATRSNDLSRLIHECGQALSPIDGMALDYPSLVTAEIVEKQKQEVVLLALDSHSCKLKGMTYGSYLTLADTWQLSGGFLPLCAHFARSKAALLNSMVAHPDWIGPLANLPQEERRLFHTIILFSPETFTARPETVATDALHWREQKSRRTARRRFRGLKKTLRSLAAKTKRD